MGESDSSESDSSESDSSAQTSNRVNVVASNIMDTRKQVFGETQGNVVETVSQVSQEPTAVSNDTSASEKEIEEKAMSRQENANELNVPDAGHVSLDTAGKTSNNVIVAQEIMEVKHVVVQETVVVETKAENVETSSTSREKNIVHDQSTSGTGDHTGSSDLDNAVQTHNKDLMPSADSDLSCHVQISSRSDDSPDSCSEKIKNLKSETHVLQMLNDVLAQFDVILEDLEEKQTPTTDVLQQVEQKYDDDTQDELHAKIAGTDSALILPGSVKQGHRRGGGAGGGGATCPGLQPQGTPNLRNSQTLSKAPSKLG